MKKYYELLTTYYSTGNITSRIYEVENNRKPGNSKKKDCAFTIVREYYTTREKAEKAQRDYIG